MTIEVTQIGFGGIKAFDAEFSVDGTNKVKSS